MQKQGAFLSIILKHKHFKEIKQLVVQTKHSVFTIYYNIHFRFYTK